MPRPCIRIQGTGSGVGAVHKKANCERERNEAPRPGASAVGLNSRSAPVWTQIKERQFPVTGSGFPVPITREFRQKAQRSRRL